MKYLLMLVTVAPLILAGTAQAQCNPDPNEIGIFWNQDCGSCPICLDYFGGPATAYVILINSTQPTGVSGFEFCLVNADGTTFNPPSGVFVTSYTYPPDAFNVHIEPCFAVGLASPLPWSPCITLIEINLLVLGLDPWCFGAVPAFPSSLPNQMVYADGSDPYVLVPMYPNTGPDAPSFAMACLNYPDCHLDPVSTEEFSWGTLKSLYR